MNFRRVAGWFALPLFQGSQAVRKRHPARLTFERLETREMPAAAGMVVPHPPALPPAAARTSDPAAAPVDVRRLPAAVPFSSGWTGYLTLPEKYRFDRRGVIQTHADGANRWYYSATAIAQLSMKVYYSFLLNRRADPVGLRLLRANADWLARHMQPLRVGGATYYVYPLPYPYPPFGLPAGTRSALTAAQAIAGLQGASLVFHDPALARAATRLLSAFYLPVGQGGYRIPLGPNAAWYEEYAHPAVAATPRVLNGHMYALVALHWYARQTGNRAVDRLVQAGLNGLQRTIGLYDDSPLSAYDLMRRGQFRSYHHAHVGLLNYFYHLTGSPRFRYYAVRWARLETAAPPG